MSAYPKPRVNYNVFSSATMPDVANPSVFYSQKAGRVLKSNQSIITSLGTLQDLNVDNININSNFVTATEDDLILQGGDGLNNIIVKNQFEITNTKSIYTPHISNKVGNNDLQISDINSSLISFQTDELNISNLLKIGGELRCDNKIKAEKFKTTNLTSYIPNAVYNPLLPPPYKDLTLTTLNNAGEIRFNSDVIVDEDKTLYFTKSFGSNPSTLRTFSQSSREGFYGSGGFPSIRFQTNSNNFGSNDIEMRREYSNFYINDTATLLQWNNNIFRAGTSYNYLTHIINGNVSMNGSISKSAGTFSIPHPLPEKKDTHLLRHSFVEAPRMDNIYRDTIRLIDGKAIVNLDIHFKMTEGTFVSLNKDVSTFTFNEENWEHIRGKTVENILTIESQNELSSALVTFMVIGERCDNFVKGDTTMTDDNGNFMPEILKPIEFDENEEFSED